METKLKLDSATLQVDSAVYGCNELLEYVRGLNSVLHDIAKQVAY